MSSFRSAQKSENEDELVADTVENIVTHMIQIQLKADHADNQSNEDYDDVLDIFSRMERLDENDIQSAFIAQLQNTALSYAANSTVPKPRF